MISPVSSLLDNPKKNEKQYKTYVSVISAKSLSSLDAPYPGAELFKKGNNYFVLDHNQQRVVYYMKYDIRTIQGHKAAYQIIVWSDMATPSIRGYANSVFFEQLFDEADIITTDRQQTQLGQRFWFNAVAMALSIGLHVYYMDRNQRKSTEIKSRKDLDNLQDEIWSNLDKAMGHLLVISPSPLKTR